MSDKKPAPKKEEGKKKPAKKVAKAKPGNNILPKTE